jgi:hypothetical protein
MLRAKALAGILASRVDGGTLGRHFPCWGRHLGAKTLLHGSLWVKTLSRSWMSDGDAFWHRVLFGGVVSRDSSGLRYFWSIVHGRHRVVGYSAVWQAERVLPSPRDGVRSHGGGRRVSHVYRLWLLEADHGDWRCLAPVSGARDCVEGRCLLHRHHGMTCLVADRGGLLSLAGLSGMVHRRKILQAMSSACWHGGGGHVRG